MNNLPAAAVIGGLIGALLDPIKVILIYLLANNKGTLIAQIITASALGAFLGFTFDSNIIYHILAALVYLWVFIKWKNNKKLLIIILLGNIGILLIVGLIMMK